MGRSVGYLNHAQEVTFFDVSDYQDFDWDNLIGNLREILCDQFPSLNAADYWEDREDHVILENSLAEIAISEYGGLASLSIRAKESTNYCGSLCGTGLGENWIALIWPRMKSAIADIVGTLLTKQGSFSNGEGVYCAEDNSRRFCHNSMGITWEF